MPETIKQTQLFRFDQMAVQVKDKVEPEEADVDRYVGLEHIDPESLKIRRWGEPSDVESSKILFRSGDIIFGKRRAYQRKLAVADFDGICSAHAMVLRPKTDVVLEEFLPFFMQSDIFMDRAVKISVGGLSPTINWRDLAKEEFALPPLDEQRRIAEALTTSNRLLESLRESQRSSETLRRSLRLELFRQGVRGESLKKTSIGSLPSSWEVRPLMEVFELLDNRRVPVKESDRKVRQGPYPYYGASGPIDFIDDYIFDEPTLLVAEDGMNLVFRNSPVVNKATGQYWVNNHAHVLRARDGINLDFYLEYLEHISYLPYITGTYQKKITRKDCEAIPLVVPSLQEQEEIVALFERLDSADVSFEARIRAAKGVQASMLREVLP